MKILLPDAKQESCGARCDKENLEDEADFLFAEHIRQKADRRYEHGEEEPREEEANEFTCFFPSVAEQPSAEIGEDEIQRQKGSAYDEGGLGEELPEDMFDALVLLYAFGRALVEHLVDRVADDVERPECQGYRHPEQADAGQAESGREQPYSQIAADIVYQRAREREAGEVAVGACCVLRGFFVKRSEGYKRFKRGQYVDAYSREWRQNSGDDESS